MSGRNVEGVYSQIIASGSVAGGGMSLMSSAMSSIAETDYLLWDFKIIITGGTPEADQTLSLYRKPGGDSPDPSAAYKQRLVKSVVLTTGNNTYYITGVEAEHAADIFAVGNDGANAVTFSVEARGRTTEDV